jgi:hypothetical protein
MDIVSLQQIWNDNEQKVHVGATGCHSQNEALKGERVTGETNDENDCEE